MQFIHYGMFLKKKKALHGTALHGTRGDMNREKMEMGKNSLYVQHGEREIERERWMHMTMVEVTKKKKKKKKEKKSKKITALRVPRLSPTLVLSKPEGA